MLPKDNGHLNRFMPTGVHNDVPPQGEDECGLPSLKAGEYEAHARPGNKPCYSLHFIRPDGSVESIQYLHICSFSRYMGGRIELVVMGMEPKRIVIEGRNLWTLYDYIHSHRMPWIMVAARDMGQDGKKAFVGAVRFEAVKEGKD